MNSMTPAIRIQRLSGSIGAAITGAALSDKLSNADFAAIHAAYLAHAVLVFPQQQLSPDQLVAFSRRFGALEQHVLKQFAHPDNADVFIVSNIKENGMAKGAIRAGQYWHTDCSYLATPTQASLLHALEIPSFGGDTMFASMSAAYDELSPPMKEFLGGLRAVHDYTLAYETYFARFADRPPLSKDEIAKVPPVEHPVIRTHPDSGRKALFVNPGFTRRIIGLEDAESRAILDFLFKHATQPHFIYRHKWSAGDLVIWDNRTSWHLAVADYDMAERRHMIRTSVQGDRPV